MRTCTCCGNQVEAEQPLVYEKCAWCSETCTAFHVSQKERFDDEFTKFEHMCGICGQVYQWSADDIAWKYEVSPFMPCGDKWEFLDKVVDLEPPYTRADAEADLATAEYWDEVARKG